MPRTRFASEARQSRDWKRKRGHGWKRIDIYGANRPGSSVSIGVLDAFWLMSMQCGLKNAYDCIEAFSESDFREDLRRFDVPTLIVHGSDDQFVPIADTAIPTSKAVKHSTLKIYEGAPHGLPVTHKERLNTDLLSFIRP